LRFINGPAGAAGVRQCAEAEGRRLDLCVHVESTVLPVVPRRDLGLLPWPVAPPALKGRRLLRVAGLNCSSGSSCASARPRWRVGAADLRMLDREATRFGSQKEQSHGCTTADGFAIAPAHDRQHAHAQASENTQRHYIRWVRRFAAFLGRPPSRLQRYPPAMAGTAPGTAGCDRRQATS
jgi:hypothetical protein